MSQAPDRSEPLQVWLDYINSVNPREIELGLDRVGAVWARLARARVAPRVITVAGTNGKGTCVAALEALLIAGGRQVGCYTSPHIDRFNERIRINAVELSDAEICAALYQIDQQRQGIALSYFEFATLAALLSFHNAGVDVAVLEVGLGGRLDAVNIIDADVAVITSISLDHMDWLGDSREKIAREKAGIMRRATPAICADTDPPLAITAVAGEVQAELLLIGKQFGVQVDSDDGRWCFYGLDASRTDFQLAGLQTAGFNRESLAAAIQALAILDLHQVDIASVLASLRLAGRFEWRMDPASGQRLIFDVAHNPGAARSLARQLGEMRRADSFQGRIAAVMAVMADKDIEGITSSLQSVVDIWYIAQVDEPRCMPVAEATQRAAASIQQPIKAFSSADAALAAALADLQAGDIVLVTGSFYTVAALRHRTSALPQSATTEQVTATQTNT